VLVRRPLDLAEAVRQCVTMFGETDRTSRHRLTLETEPVWVDADQTRIEQITENLVTNALKYTPAGGAIHLRVHRDAGEAVLRVRDSGAGIPRELLPRVFDLFVQGARTLDRNEGGLGIGLTLVRQLVEMHGGTVEAASEGAGRGSTFTVRLPAIPGPPPAPLLAPPERPGARGRRILIVEDAADAREMLRVALELSGHEVHEAEDGPGGIEAACRVRPDVALIDIGLPGVDGYEVARRIRAATGGERIRLIALTGYGQPEDRRRSLEAGFDAHLLKPVTPDHLEQLIDPPSRG
jgi:CheY-like chemotaxis protein/anti-sigma regulatory factor (Ser/Thr protein kinase)